MEYRAREYRIGETNSLLESFRIDLLVLMRAR